MSLQVFILGILSEGDHHPYDIKKKVLKTMDNKIPVNDGTLYYNFEVLRKKGLIQKIKVIQSENRPEKTTYGITDQGRKALEEEIYTTFQNFTEVSSLYGALLFLDKVDKHRIAYSIEEAIEKMRRQIKLIEEAPPGFPDIQESRREAVQLIVDHAYLSMQNDVTWLQKILVSIRSE